MATKPKTLKGKHFLESRANERKATIERWQGDVRNASANVILSRAEVNRAEFARQALKRLGITEHDTIEVKKTGKWDVRYRLVVS